jgi:Carboxypeptidase regulatory-like domain
MRFLGGRQFPMRSPMELALFTQWMPAAISGASRPLSKACTANLRMLKGLEGDAPKALTVALVRAECRAWAMQIRRLLASRLSSIRGCSVKLAVCFLLAVAPLVAQQAPPGPASAAAAQPETKAEDLCTLEGQVTNIATGGPLRKVEITLYGTQRSSPGSMPSNYSVTTDAGGNFAIKDIEPGKYRLSAQRTGFVNLKLRRARADAGWDHVDAFSGAAYEGVVVAHDAASCDHWPHHR